MKRLLTIAFSIFAFSAFGQYNRVLAIPETTQSPSRYYFLNYVNGQSLFSTTSGGNITIGWGDLGTPPTNLWVPLTGTTSLIGNVEVWGSVSNRNFTFGDTGGGGRIGTFAVNALGINYNSSSTVNYNFGADWNVTASTSINFLSGVGNLTFLDDEAGGWYTGANEVHAGSFTNGTGVQVGYDGSFQINNQDPDATLNNNVGRYRYPVTQSSFFKDDSLAIPPKYYVDSLISACGSYGPVTSVGLSLPSSFSISGSPVTTTGVLTATYANQLTGKILKAPNATGYQSTGTPAFDYLKTTDIPFRHIKKYRLVGVPFLFGDSFFIGQGATGGFGIVDQLTARNKPVTFNNLAVSGKGANVNAISSYANMPTYGNTNSVIAMFGFNDIGFGGGGSATLNKVANAYRAIAVNTWLKFAIPASAVTNTGTWSNFTSLTLKANKLSGNARQSSTSGDALSYTTTESTDNIVIGTIGTDGSTYNYGAFTVTIDGTLMTTYNPNGHADGVSDGTSDNGRTPNVLVFTNLQNTTHSISIALTSNTTTVIDYIGYMQRPQEAASFFAVGVPRRDATGYATGFATDPITTDLINTIESVTNETWAIHYPFSFINLDRTYDVVTGLNTSDHIHPNNIGHGMIANVIQYSIAEGENIITNLRISPGGTTGALTDLYANGNSFSIFHNTDRIANTKIDATRGTSIFASVATSGSEGFYWYLAAAGADPTQKMRLNPGGSLSFSNSTTGTILDFPQGSISQGSTNPLDLLGGASFDGTNFKAKNSSAATVLRLAQSTSGFVFGHNTTVTSGNTYTFNEIGRFNVTGFSIGSSTVSAKLNVVTPALSTSNIIPTLRIAPGAHTGAASTNYKDVDINISRNFGWATGTLTDQVFAYIGSPTLGFAGSSTANRPASLYVGVPVAGSNATLANQLSIHAKGNIKTTGVLLKEEAPAQITGNTNNYNPGVGSNFQLTSNGSYNVTGLQNGYNGKIVIFTNVGASNNLVFKHEDSNSTAANRFSFSTTADIAIAPNKSILIKYDSVASRWRDLAGSSMTDNIVATSASISGTFFAAGSNSFGSIISDLSLTTVGTGIKIAEGSNATMGIATLSGGTVVVNTTAVAANSRIFLTINGGTLTNVGTTYVSSRSAGTSFTITSTNASDASDVAWIIIQPN